LSPEVNSCLICGPQHNINHPFSSNCLLLAGCDTNKGRIYFMLMLPHWSQHNVA